MPASSCSSGASLRWSPSLDLYIFNGLFWRFPCFGALPEVPAVWAKMLHFLTPHCSVLVLFLVQAMQHLCWSLPPSDRPLPGC